MVSQRCFSACRRMSRYKVARPGHNKCADIRVALGAVAKCTMLLLEGKREECGVASEATKHTFSRCWTRKKHLVGTR